MVGVIVLAIVLLAGSSTKNDTVGRPVDTGSLAPLFTPVAGLRFVDAPAGLVASVRSSLDNVPGAKALFGEIQAKGVKVGDRTLAAALAVSLNERYSTSPGFADNFKAGFKTGFGADTSTDVTLAGEQATFYRKANGTGALLFLKGRVVILVAGRSLSDLEVAMTGLVTNATGHS